MSRGTSSSLRARAGDERGAVAVVVGILIVVLIGMAAVAIDLSSFWKAQRQAQAAADAGALAAAYDLPQNPGQAVTDGGNEATTNDSSGLATVTTNYNNTMNDVKVTVTAKSPSFFGQVFGISSENVSASAVAGAQGTVQQGAIFAYDSSGSCSTGINIGTNNLNISGGIESNGGLTVSSNSSTKLASGAYGSSCTYTSGNSYWTTAPVKSAPQNWPIDYRNYAPIDQPSGGCTTTYPGNYTYSTPVTITSTSVVICATGTLTIAASATNSCTPSATVTSCPGITFEAPNIVLTGSGLNLSAPYSSGAYGLLFYQSGSSPAMSMSANNSTLNGAVFAPLAELDISGNSSGTGFIEANTVVFGGNNGGGGGGGNSGNGFSITGDGPPVASNGYALLQ